MLFKIFRKRKALLNCLSIPSLFFLSSTLPAQAFTLDFSGGTLVNGTDLQQGAQYEFTDIAAGNFSAFQVDALVTIVGLQNDAILTPFTTTSPAFTSNSGFDGDNFGIASNFQPQLTVASGDTTATTLETAPTVEFSITFSNPTNDLLALNLAAQANDVDGDDGVIQEGIRFFDADNLVVGSGITDSSGTSARGDFLQGVSSSTNANPGIGDEASNLVVASFNDPLREFQFDYFFTSTGAGGALPRLNSLEISASGFIVDPGVAVPFEFSPAVGLGLVGLGIGCHQVAKRKRQRISLDNDSDK